MSARKITFSEEQIVELFGHEAAESEVPDRLRQYYFKNQFFEQVSAPLPLRVLVGHKGIGKSALFQIALHEDRQAGRLAIEVRPDDVIGIGAGDMDFLSRIKAWKDGLARIIGGKLIEKLASGNEAEVKTTGGGLLNALTKIVKTYLEKHVDLTPADKYIFAEFLKKKEIVVYMDDLDRGWQGQRADILRISALLNAVRDIARENTGIRFRVALRSDVFFLVRTSDESTDKIGSSVVWCSWTNHEILSLLVKRVETFFGNSASDSYLMAQSQPALAARLTLVIEDRFEGEGKWKNAPTYRILMSLIRRRPRDLVKLLTMAARQARADGESTIKTKHLRAIFDDYSQDRLQDTVNEYNSELPDVQRLLVGMKPNRKERFTRDGFLYETSALIEKVKAISQGQAFKDAKGRAVTPRQLAAFLYKVNFLVASKEQSDGYIDRKYFEENRYIAPDIADFGYQWEVHPAYRWALQPDVRDSIFQVLALSKDDSDVVQK